MACFAESWEVHHLHTNWESLNQTTLSNSYLCASISAYSKEYVNSIDSALQFIRFGFQIEKVDLRKKRCVND